MKRALIIILTVALAGMVFGPATSTMAASGARSLPSSVGTGESFNVDMSTPDYGVFGQVVETLPDGFSYVSSSLSPAAVTVEGQLVKFTLLGESSFSYTVAASSTAGTYTFSGILKDEDKAEYDISGDTEITVTALAPPPAPPEKEEVAPPEGEEAMPEVPAKGPNWPLIGGIIAGAVVIGLAIFFLVGRRRAA